jgi:hypothetical protein
VSRKLTRQQNSHIDKNLAWTKIPRRQKSRVDKNFASTKISLQQKSHIDKNLASNKILVSTKCWHRHRRIPLLFGSAESTAADFSQTSLKISFVFQVVLIPLHAVAKCGIASGRPAFMGGLSPALYRLNVPACHAETSQILAPTEYRRPPRIH